LGISSTNSTPPRSFLEGFTFSENMQGKLRLKTSMKKETKRQMSRLEGDGEMIINVTFLCQMPQGYGILAS
jgi:hypothetical protein